MTDISHIDDSDRSVLMAHEIDEQLLRVRGLVLVRDLLAQRGATSTEIDAHTDELERARRQLALIIGGAGEQSEFDEAA